MNVRCPICRKQCAWEGNPHRPFCGERCRTLDLGNWADESYRIAADSISEEDADACDEPPHH